jgi:hypothetical protein
MNTILQLENDYKKQYISVNTIGVKMMAQTKTGMT